MIGFWRPAKREILFAVPLLQNAGIAALIEVLDLLGTFVDEQHGCSHSGDDDGWAR